MDHLLVPDVQNIIIGLLDNITQQRLSLTNKYFKSLLPVHDPTVWEFEFRERQKLVLPHFLRKGSCTIYWGDGTVDEYTAEKDNVTLSHLFEKGTYKICIFANTDDTLFSSSKFDKTCKYMKSFIRLGKGLTDLSWFFYDTNFNGSLNHLNTSRVTNMSHMFYHAQKFNKELENWNVSNVTDMSYMFCNAPNFNKPLEKWNVSNVTKMSYMFFSASSFNQPLENWDVSNVNCMGGMFYLAFNFDQPLDRWNVSNVDNMYYMFFLAHKFKQSLENWNVNISVNMSNMFQKYHIIPAWYGGQLN